MTSSSDSVLGFLVSALWQVPALVAVAWAANRLIRDLPPARGHAVWVLTLALAILLPIPQLWTQSESTPVVAIDAETSLSTAAEVDSKSLEVAPAAPQAAAWTIDVRPDLARVLLAVFSMWVAFRLLRLARAYLATVRLRRSSRTFAPSPVLQAVSERCAAAFGVGEASILVSPAVQAPVTIGFHSPVILLPPALCGETSEDLLTAAIGHEMCHIARRDFACNLIYELLMIPISWHPATSVIARELRRTRELACDEQVRRRVLQSEAYARCIVALAAAASEESRPQYALGISDSDDLQGRIRRLLKPPACEVTRTRLMLVAVFSAATVAAVALSGSLFTARAQSAATPELKLAEVAYNRQDFRTAIQPFRNAVRVEPTNVNAKLFLANALTQAHTDEGQRPDSALLVEARQHYQDVLAYDRDNVRALHGLVVVNMLARRAEDAHATAKRLLALHPGDPGALHMAGVTSWATVFPEYQRIKQASGGRPEEYYVADAQARAELRTRFLPQIEFGIEKLREALRSNPQLHESMAYLNLLYRLKSGVANTPAEASALLREADIWVGQAVAMKRRLGPAMNVPGTVKLDVTGPPPGPAKGQMVMAPPPPPPPPPPQGRGSSAPRAIAPGEPFWVVQEKTPTEPMRLYRELTRKGFHAVLLKTESEPLVLAGPYPDPSALERAKAELEAAGFTPVRIQR
jgi:beta-lactamase regulating signal transducer with metallopeptidase domain